MTRSLLTRRDAAARYGISIRTIVRWTEDDSTGFPKAIIIRDRVYYDARQLDEWDATHRAGAQSAA
jgi:hypothetical protein